MRAGRLGIEAQQDLLLRSLLAPVDEARRSAERWLASADIDRLDPASTAILPGVAGRLRELGMESAAMARLKGVQRHHWYRNRLLWGAALEVQRRFEESGLRPVFFGGVTSLPLHHRDWGVRRVDTIDVLLPAASVAQAVSVAETFGWTRSAADDVPLAPGFVEARSCVVLAGRSERRLGLHWRLCDWRSVPTDEVAWEDVAVEIESERLRVLAPADLLVVALAGDRTDAVSGSLVWAVDGAALVAGGAVEWSRVVQLAAGLGVSQVLQRRLLWLQREAGIEVPENELAALARARRSADEQIAAALHVPGAELGPALYRGVCHLRRSRRLARRDAAYGGAPGLLRYVGEVHGLDGPAAVASHLLRRSVELVRRAWRRA